MPNISGNFEKLNVPLSPETVYSAEYEMGAASMVSLYLWPGPVVGGGSHLTVKLFGDLKSDRCEKVN